MIDELDLAFDEREQERGEKGRHRRSYVRKRNKRSRGRGKTVFALLMTLVLLGGLGGGVWFGFDRVQNYFSAPDYEGGGTGEAIVEVKEGQTATDIAVTLYQAGVVKSTKAFIQAATENSRSKNIQVGTYKLRKRMRAVDALAMLLDSKNRVVNGVTIPEGMISLAIYETLSKATKIPVAEFKKAAANPLKLGVPDWWFKRSDGKKGPKTPSIEGFLYPATYEIPPNATATDILKMMVQKFLDVTTELKFVETVQSERGGITPYEALITASIAQAESVHHQDMPKVARVIYNRVYTDRYHCKCLEIDSAINYWKRLQGKDPKDSDVLRNSEIHDPKNPYNTHDVDGLTITPISNPGEDALKGAMNPPTGTWVYFMTIDKKGTMGYGTTDEDFRNLQRTMCRNGVLTGDNC